MYYTTGNNNTTIAVVIWYGRRHLTKERERDKKKTKCSGQEALDDTFPF